MSEAMRMWVEIIFNIGYLIAVWTLVVRPRPGLRELAV